MRSTKDVYGLEAATLQIGHLRLWVRPKDIGTAIDALASLLASRRFQRHSGASLHLISAPAFTFAADSAAAYPALTHITCLNARTLPPQLPAGLKELVLEGDGQQLTTLPPNVLSNLPQLEGLTLFNTVVNIEQLPRSLATLDLIKCAVHNSQICCSVWKCMCRCEHGSLLQPSSGLQVCYSVSAQATCNAPEIFPQR